MPCRLPDTQYSGNRRMRTLWQLARERAATETLRALDLNGQRFVITILLGAIYLVLVWTLVGEKEGHGEILLRIALSIAPLILFPVVYLWNLLREPNNLYAKAQASIGELNKKLSDKRDRRRIAELLAIQMMRGCALMAKCTNADIRGRITEEECDIWKAETENVIRRELDPIQYSMYETPGGGPPSNQIPNDDFLNRTWNGLNFRVNNLRKLVEEFNAP